MDYPLLFVRNNLISILFSKSHILCRQSRILIRIYSGKEYELSHELDIEGIFRRNSQAIYRVCYSFFGNAADAEDATQATFMRLIDHPQEFEDEGHERAWLITVASNICRDVLKSASRSRTDSLPEDREFVDERARADMLDETLEAVMRLPDTYKDVVFMYYYEGMPTDEIAQALGAPPSTIRNRLRDARMLLKKMLGEDEQ